MIAAFLLGLFGSLHCAGMCGPLVLMTPVIGNTRASVIASRALYHFGRIAVYVLLGLVFGAVGESIVLAGLQRWLSLTVGALMIVAMLLAAPIKASLGRVPHYIKSLFAQFLGKRTPASVFTLGAVNGLLPCGLVYMAATASISAGSIPKSVASMAVFGIGTLPMLLAISTAGRRLNFSRLPALQKVTPVAVCAVAIVLILRADPAHLFSVSSAKPKCPACAADSPR
jgi:sulfite exporter TauE/SafE